MASTPSLSEKHFRFTAIKSLTRMSSPNSAELITSRGKLAKTNLLAILVSISQIAVSRQKVQPLFATGLATKSRSSLRTLPQIIERIHRSALFSNLKVEPVPLF
jgi:hypothetical protein